MSATYETFEVIERSVHMISRSQTEHVQQLRIVTICLLFHSTKDFTRIRLFQ